MMVSMKDWRLIIAAVVLGGATCAALTLTALALIGFVGLDVLSALVPAVVALATFSVILAQYYLSGLQWRSAVLVKMTEEKDRLRSDTLAIAADLRLLGKMLSMRPLPDAKTVTFACSRFLENSSLKTVRGFAESDTDRAINDLLLTVAVPAEGFEFADKTLPLINQTVKLILRDSDRALYTIENLYFQMATMDPRKYSRQNLAKAREILKAAEAKKAQNPSEHHDAG